MTLLAINDLPRPEELDNDAMASVAGGWFSALAVAVRPAAAKEIEDDQDLTSFQIQVATADRR